jgi:hypothetical protein
MKYINISNRKPCDKKIQVDEEDYESCSHHKWFYTKSHGGKTWYVTRNVGTAPNMRTVYLHRYLMGLKENNNGFIVDHVDGDTLNNQKLNLRICTKSENNRNRVKRKDCTSGFKGVFYIKDRSGRKNLKKRWFSSITFEKKKYYLGTHLTKEGAAKAYDRAAKKYYGGFAKLNFPKQSS